MKTSHSAYQTSLAAFAAVLLLAISAKAGTLTVQSIADSGGTCPGATCTLRQAISIAVAGDLINFALPANSKISLTSGQFVVNKRLTIVGPGANLLTVERAAGAQSFRIIHIQAEGVTVSGLTLFNGNANGDFGGAIYASNGFTLRDCALLGNSASFGGAITTAGSTPTNITNCTFSGNTASNSGGAILQIGGVGGDLFLINSTVSGNMSGVGGGGVYNGSAITIRNSTIYGNTSSAGGGISSEGSSSRIRNTIVAGNTATDANSAAPDVAGSFISEGYNLVNSNGAGNGFTAIGDQNLATNALLSPLQDNGGPTKTHALLPGSTAIDRGKTGTDSSGQLITTDQRGQPRPLDRAEPNASGGDGSDIGAVELGSPQTGPTFTVTTTLERNDGACTTDDCSLVEALNETNKVADANTINFTPGLTGAIGTAIITPSGLAISNPVTINGPGARILTVTGRTSARVFRVTSPNVYISGLNLVNGRVNNDDGGIIQNTGGLTLTDCNVTNGFAAGGISDGGALHNGVGASLTLNGCTVSASKADVVGGGVFNEGTLTATNCTFSGNSAVQGGGIYSAFSSGASKVSLRNCTITKSSASDPGTNTGDGGGGYYAVGNSGQYNLGNSIIAGNTAVRNPDLRGNFFSDGHNLIRDIGFSTGLTDNVKGDQIGTFGSPKEAQLVTTLANNGGQTDTHALQSGSTARDNGDNALAPVADQRGYFRNGVRDIGAFELNGLVPATLANISTRVRVEIGDGAPIGGFIIAGTQPKKVIIRAIGPSLTLADKLANPTLELYQGDTLLASNDNWGDSSNPQTIIDSTIPPTNNLEASIVATLAGNGTNYTAILRGANNGTGIGVVQVYDLDSSVNSKLANISTRGFVQTDDNVVFAGMIVLGQVPQKVIIRAIAPSLGIAGKLSDPTLQLVDANGAQLAFNDNWRIGGQEAQIIATTIPPSNDLESAIVYDLQANAANYTAIVRGAGGATGIAVVEIYALQ